MSTKFSRKTFLKGSVAGLGMMALNVCTAGAASAAEPAAAAAEDTNSLNLVPKKAASVKVTSRGSVSGGWQGEPVFPNWKGYVDDTLAMNHMYTFMGYAGQGTLCVEPEAGVTGFNLFVNNRQINTAAMAAGGVWNVDISGQTINGRNTIQVGGIRPRGKKVTVRVGYPTVQEGSLAGRGHRPRCTGAAGADHSGRREQRLPQRTDGHCEKRQAGVSERMGQGELL